MSNHSSLHVDSRNFTNKFHLIEPSVGLFKRTFFKYIFQFIKSISIGFLFDTFDVSVVYNQKYLNRYTMRIVSLSLAE